MLFVVYCMIVYLECHSRFCVLHAYCGKMCIGGTGLVGSIVIFIVQCMLLHVGIDSINVINVTIALTCTCAMLSVCLCWSPKLYLSLSLLM